MKKLSIKLPKFYEESLNCFLECFTANKQSECNFSIDELTNTVIWNNKLMCINGKSVYNRRLANNSIIKLGVKMSQNNKRITEQRLRVLDISPIHAFQLIALIDALPVQWWQLLKRSTYIETQPFNFQREAQLHLSRNNILNSKVQSSIVYKELRDKSQFHQRLSQDTTLS